MKTIENRSSNIELLKVIAMFLICISHCFDFSGYADVLSSNVGDVFTVMIKNCGWIGDVIFISSSVYFIIDIDPKINFNKIILYYLDSAVLFFLFYGVFRIIGLEISPELTEMTFNTTIIGKYWFVISYMGYLLIVPFAILLINHINKKTHCILMIVTTLIQLVLLILTWFYKIRTGFIILFISLFFIVSYGKRYGQYLLLKDKGNKKNLIILLVLILIWFLETMLLPLLFNNIGLDFISHTDINYIFSPLLLLIGLELFIIFKNINVPHLKFINYISSLSLIFYLVHHNAYTVTVIDPYLENIINNGLTAYRPLLLLLGFGSIIFIASIIISAIYKETFHKLFELITNKIPNVYLKPQTK